MIIIYYKKDSYRVPRFSFLSNTTLQSISLCMMFFFTSSSIFISNTL